jgi:hypothetical protein
MNADGTPANDSDNSSSPAASGSSERDGVSSTETTPPPHADSARNSKRYSNNSSAYSRSYQSVFSEPSENGFGHHRHWSTSSNRPTTAATSIADSYADEDQQDVAAAFGLLSCSYGTPNSRPTTIHGDIPPVPPLPEKYLNNYPSLTQKDVNMNDDDNSDDEPSLRGGQDDEEYMFGKMDA